MSVRHAAVRLSTAAVLLGASALVAPLQAQSPSQEAAQNQDEDKPVTKRDVLDILREQIPLEIGGGVYLWHYQPLLSSAKPHSEIYWAYLTFDADLLGDVDFHLQTMFRDTKLRPFFNSNVWIQEGYLSWKPREGKYGQLKAGKIYSRLGRFWDGSFYGNPPYFDGLKLDPDLGLSYEHNLEVDESTTLEASLQYFTRDGSTNGSLQGRDTLSFPGAVQRDSLVGRVAPTIALGDDASVTFGVSGQAFHTDFAPPTTDDEITRVTIEAATTVHELTVFGEVTWQHGVHAPGYPRAGINEDRTVYVMSGASLQAADWLKVAFNFSMNDYRNANVRELFLMPRAEFQITEATGVWLEYVHWTQDVTGPNVDLDKSFNLIFSAHF